MSAYFITATGTGTGKTFTTCALLHAAHTLGMRAQAYKPVISGWDEGAGTDTAQIIAASGGRETVDEVSPWRFRAPLSPHRAAALEGKSLALADVLRWSDAQMNQPGLTLIEGVGGVMVPLSDHETVLDWMRALGLPVILVTGSYLGTISHTLTALAALKQADLRIAALVMNESAESPISLDEAWAGLAPFVTDIPLQITQPLVSSWRDAHDMIKLLEHL